jgi:hypothetical protein
MKKLSDQITAALSATESGIFSWMLNTNKFCADEHVASLFELPPKLAECGLPLERYLERIHVEDRSRAAKSIHDTIVSGGACRQDYRIVRSDQSIVHVFAVGRCFRDERDVPFEYAGIIYDMTAEDSERVADTIADLCRAAYNLSEECRDTVLMDMLASVLNHIGRRTRPIKRNINFMQ